MTLPRAHVLERIAALALPRRERETIVADLQEEGEGGTAWMVWQLMVIGARYHAEPYRASTDRIGIATRIVAAIVLLWGIPIVTAGSLHGAEPPYSHPAMLWILSAWSASHLTSAAAAGLFLGRMPLAVPFARAARAHASLLLSLLLVAAYGGGSGLLAAAMLVVTTWIGGRAGSVAPGSAGAT